MRRPRSYWKCATDQPHPFRHWHVWCRFCRRVKIFRGPSCAGCHYQLKRFASEILKGL